MLRNLSLPALALLATLLWAPAAEAFCVYNDSGEDIFAVDDCSSMFNCFDVRIDPGQKKCCPGDRDECRGYLSFDTAADDYIGSCTTGSHGWARVRKDGGRFRIECRYEK